MEFMVSLGYMVSSRDSIPFITALSGGQCGALSYLLSMCWVLKDILTLFGSMGRQHDTWLKS
jgi:hypothetical protein